MLSEKLDNTFGAIWPSGESEPNVFDYMNAISSKAPEAEYYTGLEINDHQCFKFDERTPTRSSHYDFS